MQGYIKLHRKIITWEWYEEPNVFRLFLHCLLKANHKDKKWRGNLIKRGSFITSLETLSKETRLTIQQVRTSLDKLILTKEINKVATNLSTCIIVNNYHEYQIDNKPVTNEQQTDNKRITTTKNDKNDKNDNNDKNDKKRKRPPLNLKWITIDDLQRWLDKKQSEGHIFTIDIALALEKCKNHYQAETRYIGTAYNWIMQQQEWFNEKETKHGKLTGAEWARQQKT